MADARNWDDVKVTCYLKSRGPRGFRTLCINTEAGTVVKLPLQDLFEVEVGVKEAVFFGKAFDELSMLENKKRAQR
ncbi:hypothetical protein [Laceyella tengchongensis]|uniref:hypothetical protein n=1 Tax=Laceyella tengchongensis TaxID=574699 RepID=UPI0012B7520B|nr:hypothetical protein [Laceyella tengchongensis]